MKKISIKSGFITGIVLLFAFSAHAGEEENSKTAGSAKIMSEIIVQYDSSVKPYTKNPWYWEYKGEPIMLIGASDDDNLFQWGPDTLVQHLDLIQSVGGNYVRNTMSDRDEGNLFAPKKLDDGKYDLEQWNEEYWNRLKFFLDETEKRDIIVHLTLWDWFDLSGDDVYGRFAIHPINPENNINWEKGTIKDAWDYYGGSLSNQNKEAIDYQHRYISKLISIAAQYNHVIYNIGNESGLGIEWDNYWARFIKDAAKKQGNTIHVTHYAVCTQ